MKNEADIVTETLRETEPAKVLERRREALEKFYEAKQREGEGEDEGRASPALEAPPPKELPATATTKPARRGGSWKRVLAAAVVGALSPFAVILGGQIKESMKKITPAPSAAAVVPALDTSLAVGGPPRARMVVGAGPMENASVSTAPSVSAPPSVAATSIRSTHSTAIAHPRAPEKPPEVHAEPPDAGGPPVDPTPRPPPSVFVGGQKPEFN